MNEVRAARDWTITWVVDATPPYCFVTQPGVMEDFAATLAVLEAPGTFAEFIDRTAAHDPEILRSLFNTDVVDEIRTMSEDGDIMELDAPWSAADISSYDIIPDNRCFFGESTAPAVLADLFVDAEGLEEGWEYRSIPHERYGEVLTRLRAAGIPFVERPGAVFDLVASVHGGDLR